MTKWKLFFCCCKRTSYLVFLLFLLVLWRCREGGWMGLKPSFDAEPWCKSWREACFVSSEVIEVAATVETICGLHSCNICGIEELFCIFNLTAFNMDWKFYKPCKMKARAWRSHLRWYLLSGGFLNLYIHEMQSWWLWEFFWHMNLWTNRFVCHRILWLRMNLKRDFWQMLSPPAILE